MAYREFLSREDRRVDPKRLRVVIDGLEGEAAAEARASHLAGDHHAGGNQTVVGWLSRLCGMSATSTADRLCVGKELESLPKIAEALRSGQISYQSTALLCHLRDQLGPKAVLFDEEEMLGYARIFTVARLRYLCRVARHVADPDGVFNDAEADFSNRRLQISQMSDGMYCVDAILDPECGAAFKTALESLATRLGPDDERSHKQRMADSVGELVHHALDEGRLPRRNGVKPHINLTTTVEGIKNELGAPPADLELSLPISTRTLERIACDCTMSRVLLAESMVIDVGRATRVVSAPTRRALRTRDHGCRFPGCDRQVPARVPRALVARGRPSPHRFLVEGWSHQVAQSPLALLLPPSTRARRWLAGGESGSRVSVRATRSRGLSPSPGSRFALGRLRSTADLFLSVDRS